MKKLYVLVRNDLAPIHRAVQGAHAVAAYLQRGPRTDWNNGYLIMLGVKDRKVLNTWMKEMLDKDIAFEAFREPDMNDELTAVAAVHDGDFFKSLPLLEV